MPRSMPPFAGWFQQRVTEALALAQAGDLAGASPIGTAVRLEWHVARVELLYELAYLRMFIEWESMLEQTFFRYLCGYVSPRGVFPPVGPNFQRTLPLAEATVLGTNTHLLWHNPDAVIARARRFLVSCPHESVIASNRARLVDLAAVRHRIAH